MRGDRSAAGLTVATAVISAGVAAASLWLPATLDASAPRSGEVLVGWTLLAGGVVLIRRAPTIAAVVWVAGVVWAAVGVAPLFDGPVASATLRAALLPMALLAVAALLLPAGRLHGRADAAAVVVVLAVAVAAGSGWFELPTVAIGVATLVASVRGSGTLTPARSRAAAQGIGAGLGAVGLLEALSLGSPWFVSNLFEMVVLAGAICVIWQSLRFADLRRVIAFGTREDDGLGSTLGAALQCEPLTVTFQDDNGGWIDPSGAPTAPPTGDAVINPQLDQPTRPMAWITPSTEFDRETGRAVGRLLVAAGEVARVRARMRQRADEIVESRRRLVRAGDLEQARLVELIEAGPLAKLARARELIAGTSDNVALLRRVLSAEQTMRGVLVGLDPVAAAGGLAPAVTRLAQGHNAMSTIESVRNVPATTSRVVWFACAEAIANASKHAPGAKVYVTLGEVDESFQLTVSDDGPGGADPTGAGLSSLGERAAGVGGSLTVTSAPGDGTVIRLCVPADDARWRVADPAPAPIRSQTDSPTMRS